MGYFVVYKIKSKKPSIIGAILISLTGVTIGLFIDITIGYKDYNKFTLIGSIIGICYNLILWFFYTFKMLKLMGNGTTDAFLFIINTICIIISGIFEILIIVFLSISVNHNFELKIVFLLVISIIVLIIGIIEIFKPDIIFDIEIIDEISPPRNVFLGTA